MAKVIPLPPTEDNPIYVAMRKVVQEDLPVALIPLAKAIKDGKNGGTHLTPVDEEILSKFHSGRDDQIVVIRIEPVRDGERSVLFHIYDSDDEITDEKRKLVEKYIDARDEAEKKKMLENPDVVFIFEQMRRAKDV